MIFNGNMITGQKVDPVSTLAFDTLLDEACERLMDRQVKYSIQRIHELEKRLGSLERELDEFINRKKR